jgi:alpha-1,2-mannosyltransferase
VIGATATAQNARPRRVPVRGRLAAAGRDPVIWVIAAATAVGLALRLWQLSRPGYLLGVTEYDDGPYFGSAVRLVDGALPYRAFVLVQPPGITLLMVPAALAGKVAGTAWGMAAGRILTTLASAAGIALAGLLVRHRGALAALVACGVLAVYPDSVAAAHTVLVEPWLVLACLAGGLAVFDGDRITASTRRLAWGGAAFGFAGAVESWAILPVLVLLALCMCWSGGMACWRRAGVFAGGVAAGFAVPVLPFAALAPRGFYDSLIVAQVGPRAGVQRVPVLARLQEMAGLSYAHFPLRLGTIHLPGHTAIVLTAAAVALFTTGGLAVAALASHARPEPLDWFAVVTLALVVAVFLWPSQFHYHFCAFLAPFLGLAIALPLDTLAAAMTGSPARPAAGPGWPARAVAAVAAVILGVCTAAGFAAENALRPDVSPATIAAAARRIPPGSCVVTDEVSLILLADRFTAQAPGCSPVLDGLGTDLALSGGLKPATGAGRVPAVAAVWWQAFQNARFAWLSRLNHRRIAWTPALRGYFRSHFTRVLTDRRGDALYRRTVHRRTATAGVVAGARHGRQRGPGWRRPRGA